MYFAVVGSAYTKFSRYMLPIFAPLVICGAGALVALAAWGTRRLARMASAPASHVADASSVHSPLASLHLLLTAPSLQGRAGLGLVRRATAVWGMGWWRGGLRRAGAGRPGRRHAFFTLALLNIYSAPNTRVQASEWIYDHIQAGTTLHQRGLGRSAADLGAGRAHGGRCGPHRAGACINPGQYPQVGLNLYDADTPTRPSNLREQLASANVVVISSQRLLRSIPKLPDRYPMTTRYYQLLFAGQARLHAGRALRESPATCSASPSTTPAPTRVSRSTTTRPSGSSRARALGSPQAQLDHAAHQRR